MPWLQVTLDTTRDDAQPLSDALAEAGALSVSIEGADAEPLFETDWNDVVPVWQQARVLALFTEDADIPEAMRMTATLLSLAKIPPYKTEPVADQDWVRVWMDRWKPMHFGARLWVVPSWLSPPDPHAANIILDPGMAFGTGTHATTALCLEWLAAHPPAGLDVIDFGCGSGILAIAALKLGARRAWGTDTDSQALTVSRENAERNRVQEHLVLCLPADLPTGARADVLLANILAPALVALAPQLTALTDKHGLLLLSGLLAHQVPEVQAVYSADFSFEQVIRENWALLVGRRKH